MQLMNRPANRSEPGKNSWIRLLGLGLLLCCCACVSTGTKAINDPQAVSMIEVGKTTKDEVTALLGLPVAVYFPQDHEEQWNYPYLTEYPWAPDFIPVVNGYADLRYQTRILTVVFAKDGTVKKVEQAGKCCGQETVPKYF
jgi:outer membrane protein assembly factor BamE (lipoprotein component of BamABCDE complex)